MDITVAIDERWFFYAVFHITVIPANGININEKGENIMFHKKALRNTLIFAITAAIVFSVAAIAIFAATGTSASTNISVRMTAEKHLLGDSGSISGSYKSGTHKHVTLEFYNIDGSYMGCWLALYGNNSDVRSVPYSKDYNSTSVSNSKTAEFGWAMISVAGYVDLYCGSCRHYDTCQIQVAP